MKREDEFLLAMRKRFSDVKLEREQMHVYQSETAYQHLLKNPFSALFIDMGLGKTVSTASVVVDLLNEFDNDDKVLIVGPLRVATTTWPDEFRAWRHLAPWVPELVHVSDDDPALKEAARGARASCRDRQMFRSEVDKVVRDKVSACKTALREKRATSSRTIHIISGDWLDWLVNFYGTDWPYRTVIIDESSAFKDHTTRKFQALQSIVEVQGLITRMHLLTATPAAETYEHLYAQMFLLDRGARLGRNITAFRNKYMRQNRWSKKWELLDGAKEQILAKISDIVLVMKEEDYLPRVQPLFVEHQVVMTDDQMALYNTMQKEMIVTLTDGTEIEAKTAAAVSAKLLQMASGVLYETYLKPGETDDDDHVKIHKVHKIHDHKMQMLKQIVEESMGKNILVSYSHRSTLARLKSAFPKAVVMDTEGKCKKAWNSGKIKMLLMHPKSGGHGLNLQEGGHHIVYFDIPWSLELYQQLIGRLSRQGQKFRVIVHLLLCKDTLDYAVMEALRNKTDAQDILFKLLKRMKARLRRLMKKRRAAELTPDEITEILVDCSHQEDQRESEDDEL